MRVLHVAETIKGGVSTYLNSVVRYQAATDSISQVQTLTPDSQRSEVEGLKGTAKLDVHTFWGEGRLGRCLGLWSAFRQRIKAERPDLVHLHSSFSGLLCRTALLFDFRIKVIYQPHGISFDPDRTGIFSRLLYRFVERLLLIRTSRVIAISEYEKGLLDTAGFSARTALVWNAVEESRLSEAEREAARNDYFLFVGRFDRQKGFDLLYRFWCRRPEKLLVIGDSVLSGEPEFPARDNVEFIGWVEQERIDAFYAGARALIVPSRWEGFGLVVPEAYRNGTPVLCTRQGALPFLVTDGETGFSFDIGNFDRGLATAMAALDHGDHPAMAENCRRQYQSKYTLEKMNASLLKIYFEAVGPVVPG